MTEMGNLLDRVRRYAATAFALDAGHARGRRRVGRFGLRRAALCASRAGGARRHRPCGPRASQSPHSRRRRRRRRGVLPRAGRPPGRARGDRRCRRAREAQRTRCVDRSRGPLRAAAVSFAKRSTRSTADRVAVAHTRDDQAETVLLRLVRGAGASGLAAMAPRRDHLVRPLLDVTRAELQDLLREHATRRGARTRPISIARFRATCVRHEVMPQLRTINAQADAALARAAELLRGDEEFLETLANAAFIRCVETDSERRSASASHVGGVPEAAGGAGAARGAVCARNRQPVPIVWLRRGRRALPGGGSRHRRKPSGTGLGTFRRESCLSK